MNIFTAIKKNNIKKVVSLIKNEREANATNNWGEPALTVACIDGNLAMVKALVELGAEVNKADADGYTALHAASYANESEIARYLISKGAGVNLKNNAGQTALHDAVKNNALKAIEILLDNSANINSLDLNKSTPLMIACEYKCEPQTINFLVSKGAGIELKNKNNETALEISLLIGVDELAITLAKNKAKLKSSIISMFDKDNKYTPINTPLDILTCKKLPLASGIA